MQRTIATSDPLKGDEYFREIYLREVDRWLKHCMCLITAGLRSAVMHLNDLVQSSLWQFQDLLIQLSVAAFSLGCITGKCRIKKELPRHKDAFRTGHTEDCRRPKTRQ